MRLTRVRGVPLASETLGFDASFRQRLDVLASGQVTKVTATLVDTSTVDTQAVVTVTN